MTRAGTRPHQLGTNVPGIVAAAWAEMWWLVVVELVLLCRVSSVGRAGDAVGIARRRRYRSECRRRRGAMPPFISGKPTEPAVAPRSEHWPWLHERCSARAGVVLIEHGELELIESAGETELYLRQLEMDGAPWYGKLGPYLSSELCAHKSSLWRFVASGLSDISRLLGAPSFGLGAYTTACNP